MMAPPGQVILPSDSPLRAALDALAREARLVFFAGLPGTGKSLLIHQLAHLGHAQGRRIHLLQWDVARPLFEASGPGRRYPQERGVTHGLIRLAVGRWARAALARWHAEAGSEGLLIGETPFVGHRLIELARPEGDAAEAVLSAPWTRFVIPVPSRALRAHLEAERERRAREPLHPREEEDAPPAVLRDLWRGLVQVARMLGVAEAAPGPGAPDTGARFDGEVPYDPDIYRRVYERLLVHRRARVLPMDAVLPTSGLSAYDLAVPAEDLVPTGEEAGRLVSEAEAAHPDPGRLERAIEDWYRVPDPDHR